MPMCQSIALTNVTALGPTLCPIARSQQDSLARPVPSRIAIVRLHRSQHQPGNALESSKALIKPGADGGGGAFAPLNPRGSLSISLISAKAVCLSGLDIERNAVMTSEE